jgi:hypothetical protein
MTSTARIPITPNPRSSAEKLEMLRQADAIIQEEIRRSRPHEPRPRAILRTAARPEEVENVLGYRPWRSEIMRRRIISVFLFKLKDLRIFLNAGFPLGRRTAGVGHAKRPHAI